MNELRLAENIASFRKLRGITQDELADFLGVTKASVSKWENGQSLPDILLLPKLAVYFNLTIDELMGYEPQLSKEQIQKIYGDFGKRFASEPFEVVFADSKILVKKYYSCYIFLEQICILWVNHYMLPEKQEQKMEVLKETEGLCNHILANCKNVGICNDMLVIRAMVQLLVGKPELVIEEMEEIMNPCRLLNQSDGLLTQAYFLKGDMEKADRYTQISMYTHLLQLVGSAMQYLMIHAQQADICKETMQRVDKVIEAYRIKELHKNTMANYSYQAAVCYSLYGEKEEAIKRLEVYAECAAAVISDEVMLHADGYFTKLDSWFEEFDLGTQLVRDKQVILESVRESLLNPVFEPLRKEKGYKRIEHILENAVCKK